MSDYLAIVPLVCVWFGGILAMLAEAFRSPGEQMPMEGIAIGVLLTAGVTGALLWGRGAVSFGVVSADNFGLFVTLVLVVVGILTVALSSQVVERDGINAGEYYALTLFAIGGMMLMATATDLLVIFIALEILSLSVYILTGIRRESKAGAEAAFKYFLLGGFSSAFFLYGIAFTYGIAGTTRLDEVVVVMSGLSASNEVLSYIAMGLLLVGFAFKVSAVPFHMWTPDAYEGAPAVVTAFMSAGVKAAAFAAFVRVFMSAFGGLQPQWEPVIWMLSAASMILGAVAGVVQRNVRRMLAYSSIAHAGYLLMAMAAGNDMGKGAILFYLLTYALTSVGAFGITALVATRDARQRRSRRLRRARDAPAAARVSDDDLPAVARRLSADRRLHRQVVSVQRRGQRRRLRPCHHRRAHERRLGVLLPARRGDDVHVRPAVDRAGDGAVGRIDLRARGADGRDLLPRPAARARARARAGIDRDDPLSLTATTRRREDLSFSKKPSASVRLCVEIS